MSRAAARALELDFPARRKATPSPKKPAYSRRRFWAVMVLIAYVGLLGVGRVFVQALGAQTSLEISSREALLKRIALENEKLRLQEVVLRSPARIERIAVQRLGMVQPEQVNYVTVEVTAGPKARSQTRDGGRLRVAASAQ